jgi:hypothetical protein
MIERTDTNIGLPVGHYVFTVSSPVEKRKFENNDKKFYLFKFTVQIGENLMEHQERIPVWMAAEIIKAVGGKEITPGVFEWDRDGVIGEQIEGDIVLEKVKDGKEYKRLRNIKQKLPF